MSRLGAKLRRTADRQDHDGHRCSPAGGGADRYPARTRTDVRLLVAAGYGLLAIGWGGNGFMTYETDFWGLFWQQTARGAAVMLCLLPTTALALGSFDPAKMPNGSGQPDAQSRRGDRAGGDRHGDRTARRSKSPPSLAVFRSAMRWPHA